jgi:hypothetical protein
MKKSHTILLGLTVVLAQACGGSSKDEGDWTYGEPNSRDTTVRGQPYRSYYGYYYPVYRGMIAPSLYEGATKDQVSAVQYRPVRSSERASATRTGGFGRTGGGRSVWS